MSAEYKWYSQTLFLISIVATYRNKLWGWLRCKMDKLPVSGRNMALDEVNHVIRGKLITNLKSKKIKWTYIVRSLKVNTWKQSLP